MYQHLYFNRIKRLHKYVTRSLKPLQICYKTIQCIRVQKPATLRRTQMMLLIHFSGSHNANSHSNVHFPDSAGLSSNA